MNIFVHLGLQKTGTTALQKVFERIEDLQYFHYLDWYAKINPDQDILFSNEDLSGHIYLEKMDRYRILENIKYVFPDAKIIVGFRKPEEWFHSIYKESVCQGYPHSFGRFCYECKKEFYLDFDLYEKCIRKLFKDVFVYQFEDLKQDYWEVVKDICKFMNKKVPKYSIGKVNPSLNDYQILALRFINRFFRGPYNPNGLIKSAVNKKIVIKMRGI